MEGYGSRVRSDLEKMGYAVGTADICAASVGAPHIRQRLWWVADSLRYRNRQEEGSKQKEETMVSRRHSSFNRSERLGDANGKRLQKREGIGRIQSETLETKKRETPKYASNSGFWDEYELVWCRDGKARRIEPGSFPLAHGIPNRVGRLRAYGNAIVPQVAVEFIKSFMEIF